jgi:predicted ATPase
MKFPTSPSDQPTKHRMGDPEDDKPMQLRALEVRNFKAIANSGWLRVGSLTVFVGHNGSGKSSLIEALETYQSIVVNGLDIAMQRWLGIEHVRHFAAEGAMSLQLDIGQSTYNSTDLTMEIQTDAQASRIGITKETARHTNGWAFDHGKVQDPGRSILTFPRTPGLAKVADHIRSWQFLSLQPENMGLPVPQKRTSGQVRLAKDGSNIADYLLDIQRLDRGALEGIVQAMAYVLPFASDLKPLLTSELERKAYLQVTEGNFKVPGWMLSTGTLRVLALLALLRHPQPPPLILIEEIENGLDPRSIHLLVEEIRAAVLDGITQVMLTTHSPYLLDLLKLDQLVLVARDQKGEPRFHRPASDATLREWAKEFAPGRLYTMGSLHEAVQ